MSAADARTALLEAYQAALYEVEVMGEVFVIGVDRRLPAAIVEQLESREVSDAAFLSAANPRSRRCSDAQNSCRHQALLSALVVLGVSCLPGNGRDPGGVWPDESAVLAFGLGRERALQLAEEFGQNAYLEVVPGAPVRLVLTGCWT